MKKMEAHAITFLKEIHVLNVYEINTLQILTFMQKVKNATIHVQLGGRHSLTALSLKLVLCLGHY